MQFFEIDLANKHTALKQGLCGGIRQRVMEVEKQAKARDGKFMG